MYFTINKKKSTQETTLSHNMRASTQFLRERSAVGTPLTSYKKVVDISKIIHYGLSTNDYKQVQKKLQLQKNFLDFSFLYDRINKNHIPLSNIVISAYHSPQRYYAQTQNRVNTIETLAKQRGLKALFMTLTLPSEYHPCKTTKQGKLIANVKYNGVSPKDASKELTRMFARLRQDRSLKDLHRDERIYIRVNEPHKDGTPHAHILMFIPEERIERIKRAYKRLYDARANDIQVITDDINNSVAYVMKYINKVLPLSKKDKLSEKEQYLNACYSKNHIIRFNSSRTLAPLRLYRLLHNRFSMYALTKLHDENEFKIFVELDTDKVVEIIDSFGESIYLHSDNYDVKPQGSYVNNSQTNDSAIGMVG